MGRPNRHFGCDFVRGFGDEHHDVLDGPVGTSFLRHLPYSCRVAVGDQRPGFGRSDSDVWVGHRRLAGGVLLFYRALILAPFQLSWPPFFVLLRPARKRPTPRLNLRLLPMWLATQSG